MSEPHSFLFFQFHCGFASTFFEVDLWKAGLACTAFLLVGFGLVLLWQERRTRAGNGKSGSDEMFRTLVEQASDGIFIADREGRYLDVNRAGCEMLGYRREELLQLRMVDLVSPSERPSAAASVEALRQGQVRRTERQLRRKVGTLVSVETSAKLLSDGRILAILRDITERRAAEDAARKQQALLQNILTHIPHAVFWKDCNSVYLGGNPNAAHDAGLASPEDLVGKTDHDLPFFREEADAYVASDHQVIAENRPVLQIEQTQRRPDGTQAVLSTSKVPLRDEMGKVIGILGIYTDITEQKQMEKALAESEARFQAFMDFSPVVSFIKDEGGRYIYGNRAWCLQFGKPREELLGCTDADLWPTESVNLFSISDRAAIESAQPFEQVESGVTAWGTQKHWMVLKFPMTDSSGRRLLGGVVMDITERKMAEEAVRKSEKHYRDLVETSNDLIWSVDTEGRWTFLNRSATLRIYGYEPEEMLGRRFTDFESAEVAERDLAVFNRHKAGEPVHEYETTHLRKDGTPVLLSFNAILLRDETGTVIGTTGTASDITERKRAEEALRQSEAKYRSLVETTDTGFVIVDGEGRVIDANAEYVRLTGYDTLEEIRGRSVIEWTAAHDLERNAAEVRKCAEQGYVRHLQIDYVDRQEQTTPIEINAKVITTEQGPRIIALCRDITDRQRLEDQLRQAQKMEAVGQLAGGVAHDFNNMLTVITGYSSLLLAGQNSDAPSRELLEGIRKAADRAASLTKQLLAFSRKQMLAPVVLDLNAVVTNTYNMLRRLIGEDIDLHMELHPQLPTVRADPGQIVQVLMNLAVNSRDAMPNGGKLTLSTRDMELDAYYFRTQADVKPGRYVQLTAADTGLGMDADTLEHLFEPFFTTKEVGKGTGLGLATAYGIVKQSGGHIDVESQLGQGTSFHIYLPSFGERVQEPPTIPSPSQEQRGTETILVVEDDDSVRSLVRRVLERNGYQVLEARHGKEGLALCRNYAAPIQLILSDVIMPEMSGREFFEQVAPLRPGIKLLYMSGYTDDALIRQGVQCDSTRLLSKPFTPASLTGKVREVLDEASAFVS